MTLGHNEKILKSLSSVKFDFLFRWSDTVEEWLQCDEFNQEPFLRILKGCHEVLLTEF